MYRRRQADQFIVEIFSEACFDITRERREYFDHTRFLLQITGHPSPAYPFGQDRLVPIFLTLAAQQKSQTVGLRIAAEMLESFGMHTGGKEHSRLVCAFGRIFGARIFFGTDSFSRKAPIIHRSRFNSCV